MKKILIIATFLATIQGYAQDSNSEISEKDSEKIKLTNNEGIEHNKILIDFEVKEILFDYENMPMSKGDKPSIIMDIPEVKVGQIMKEWSNRIKNDTKSNVETVDNEVYIYETIIEEISNQLINVYAQITENIYGTRIIAFFEIDGAFLSESLDENKFNGANLMMRNFGITQYQNTIQEQIKIEKKMLSDFENELDKYQKKNTKLHKQIKENEQDIIDTENDISINLIDQDLKVEQINEQKKIIARSGGKTQKEAEKKLKEIESDRKDLQSVHKDLNKNNITSRGELENIKIEINKNLSEQDILKDKIRRKLSELKSKEEKLVNIK